MNGLKRGGRTAVRVLCLVLLGAFFGLLEASAAQEETFDVIQIGTRTYRNVTVTTKTKNYIMMLHSEGLASIKVNDLSPELLQKLGYAETKPKDVSKAVNAWTRQAVSKVESPQVKAIEQKIIETRLPVIGTVGNSPDALLKLSAICLGILAVWHLFFSWCFRLICQKAGHKPTALVWLPLLQMVPLLQAAGMSGWWLLGLFIPGVNVIGLILWAVNISKARGKGALTVLCLILPGLNVLGILYLAFSSTASAKKPGRSQKIDLMTLETA